MFEENEVNSLKLSTKQTVKSISLTEKNRSDDVICTVMKQMYVRLTILQKHTQC